MNLEEVFGRRIELPVSDCYNDVIERKLSFEEARRRNLAALHIGMTPMNYDPALVPENAAVELKYDGIGMVTRGSRLMTLEGVEMRCADHLLRDFQELEAIFGERMVFQSEYVVPGGGAEHAMSAFNKGEPGLGTAFVFDALSFDAWQGLTQSPNLYTRRQNLETAFEIARCQTIRLAQHAQGFEAEGIELAAGVAWAAGMEGLVVKDLEAPFIRRRDASWLKVKRNLSDDLPIQAIMRNADGTVQKIICTRDGQPIAVPNGFARYRSQPGEFWAGRIVEIAHDGVTNGGFLKSPRFARFRDDKGGVA